MVRGALQTALKFYISVFSYFRVLLLKNSKYCDRNIL